MSRERADHPLRPTATALLICLALVKVAIHFLTNGNYGYFREVEQAAVVVSRYARENNIPVFVCRRLKRPVEEIWPELKMFV